MRTAIAEAPRPISDTDALAAIRETGWARPKETGYLWHYFTAGRAICHRSLSWPWHAEESDTAPSAGVCVECRRRCNSKAPAKASKYQR